MHLNKGGFNMQIGRKIYYDKSTGNILVDTGEKQGFVREATIEQEIQTYKALSERNRDTFDVIKLEFGQYRQDFMECNGYRVSPETRQLEFSYPDPNGEEPQEPIYQKPLSEEVKELETALLEATTLIASQEQKATQNEQAILELTMMIGGM